MQRRPCRHGLALLQEGKRGIVHSGVGQYGTVSGRARRNRTPGEPGWERIAVA